MDELERLRAENARLKKALQNIADDKIPELPKKPGERPRISLMPTFEKMKRYARRVLLENA